eukprot:2963545-Prymnesium_polylepis.1
MGKPAVVTIQHWRGGRGVRAAAEGQRGAHRPGELTQSVRCSNRDAVVHSADRRRERQNSRQPHLRKPRLQVIAREQVQLCVRRACCSDGCTDRWRREAGINPCHCDHKGGVALPFARIVTGKGTREGEQPVDVILVASTAR